MARRPTWRFLDGETITLTPSSLPTDRLGVPGIVTCELPPTRLGFASPSLFLLTRSPLEGNGVTVFARTEDAGNAQAYISAAAMVTPLIHLWLGSEPKGTLNIVDLPEANDAPFEDGTVLFTDVRSTEPEKLTDVLVHSLTHFTSARLIPGCRRVCLPSWGHCGWRKITGARLPFSSWTIPAGALSLAEPGDVAGSDQQALLMARDPVYYRTKATYVLWMLRDLAGDAALGRALRAYQPGSDTSGTGFEQVLEREAAKT